MRLSRRLTAVNPVPLSPDRSEFAIFIRSSYVIITHRKADHLMDWR